MAGTDPLDADSDGEEGKYFVWQYDEIDSLLTKYDAAIIKQYFGITEIGYFEGVINAENNLGVFFKDQGNFSKAGKFFEKALKLSEKLKYQKIGK